MDQTFSSTTSMWVLSLVRLFERMSYYGMRGLLVLYAVDEMGLGMERTEAFTYYGIFTTAIYLFNIPMGLLSDFLLKQKNGTCIGFAFLILGYLTLIIPNLYAVVFALLFISIGTGLVSPNLIVLMGNLFKKENKNRDSAFVIYYTAINIGAFLGVLALGYIGETYGFNWGFAFSAVASMLAVTIFILTMKNLDLVEDNRSRRMEEKIDDNPQILDYSPERAMGFKNQPPPLPSQSPVNEAVYLGRYFMIFIILIVSTIFWQIYEFTTPPFFENFDIIGSFSTLGISISQTIAYGLGTYFSFPAAIIILLFLTFGKKINTTTWLGIGFVMVAIYMAFFFFKNLSSAGVLGITFISFFILAAAEIIIAAIGLSFVTRLSNVKYASTTVGVFFVLIALGGRFLNTIIQLFDDINIWAFAFIPLLIGIVFLLGRKLFLQITGGLG